MQRKIQRPAQSEITEATRESIAAWVTNAQLRSTNHLFCGRGDETHLSTRQYSRIVRAVQMAMRAFADKIPHFDDLKVCLVWNRTRDLS